MKKILLIISVVVVTSIVILAFTFSYLTSPVSASSETVFFTVTQGETSKAIAADLAAKNLIKSKTMMYLVMRSNDKTILAGTYELKPNMDLFAIVDTLTSGKVAQSVIITIPEGKNMRQFATIVSNKTNHSYSEVMAAVNDRAYVESKTDVYPWLTDTILDSDIYYPLEGYLFPDTYAIESKDTKITVLTDKMLAKMDQVINDELKGHTEEYSYHQLLTMASIVELEGLNKESRKTVASIFYNRLKIKMALGSDVTTYYSAKVNLNERDLKRSEIDADNPYNTRGPNMAGKLPIGPIAAPSLSAIQAAVNPANTDYLYFVADKNGKMYYTKSYAEHNNIIAKLKREGLWYTWT